MLLKGCRKVALYPLKQNKACIHSHHTMNPLPYYAGYTFQTQYGTHIAQGIL